LFARRKTVKFIGYDFNAKRKAIGGNSLINLRCVTFSDLLLKGISVVIDLNFDHVDLCVFSKCIFYWKKCIDYRCFIGIFKMLWANEIVQ